jgi:hypothetical protein
MARTRNTHATPSNTGNVSIGINLPVDSVNALDNWALASGFVKYDGSANRSSAFRALINMWLSGDRYLLAAVKAKNIGLIGSVADVAREAYQKAYEKVVTEIARIEVIE